MQEALDTFLRENIYLVLFLWWLFSNAVENMPSPNGAGGWKYRWLYGTLNGLAGNVREALTQKGWGTTADED